MAVEPAVRARARAGLTLVLVAAGLWWLWFSVPVLAGSTAHPGAWPRLVLLFFALPAGLPILAALCWRGSWARTACALLAAGLFAAGLAGTTVPVWNWLVGASPLARELAVIPVEGGRLTVRTSDCGATSCPPVTWIEQEREVVDGLHRRWTVAERRPATGARVRVLPGARIEVTWIGALGEPLGTESFALHRSAWTR